MTTDKKTPSINMATIVRYDGDGLQKIVSNLTALDCSVEPSKTQQNFRDECDINSIMSQYEQTGYLPEPSGLSPRYGDTTLLPDFQTAQNLIIEANATFAALPAEIRKRFNNDPASLVAFVSEPGHEDELRALGLLPAAQEAPAAPAATPLQGPPQEALLERR